MKKSLLKLKNVISLALIIMSIVISCDSPANDNKTENLLSETETLMNEILPTEIVLRKTVGMGFTAELGDPFDMGESKTYLYLQLLHNDKLIYVDTSESEYEFIDTSYPKIFQVDTNSYQILLPTNNRPGKNKLMQFLVVNDKVVNQEVYPLFEDEPSDVNNDGVLEYSDYLDDGQGIDIDKMYIVYYNPILFYTITNKGIKLDSSLTIDENIEMYGKFYGFKLDYNIIIDTEKKIRL
jgi:hypothetical protein